MAFHSKTHRGQQFAAVFDDQHNHYTSERREVNGGHYGRLHVPNTSDDVGWEVGEQDRAKFGGVYYNQASETLGLGLHSRNISHYPVELDVESNAPTLSLNSLAAGASSTMTFKENGATRFSMIHDAAGSRFRFIDFEADPDAVMFECYNGRYGPRFPGGFEGSLVVDTTALTSGQTLTYDNSSIARPAMGSCVLDSTLTAGQSVIIRGVNILSTSDMVYVSVQETGSVGASTTAEIMVTDVTAGASVAASGFTIVAVASPSADFQVSWMIVHAGSTDTSGHVIS